MPKLSLRRSAAVAGVAVKRVTWPAILLAAMAAGLAAPAVAQQSPAAQRGLTFVRLDTHGWRATAPIRSLAGAC